MTSAPRSASALVIAAGPSIEHSMTRKPARGPLLDTSRNLTGRQIRSKTRRGGTRTRAGRACDGLQSAVCAALPGDDLALFAYSVTDRNIAMLRRMLYRTLFVFTVITTAVSGGFVAVSPAGAAVTTCDHKPVLRDVTVNQ